MWGNLISMHVERLRVSSFCASVNLPHLVPLEVVLERLVPSLLLRPVVEPVPLLLRLSKSFLESFRQLWPLEEQVAQVEEVVVDWAIRRGHAIPVQKGRGEYDFASLSARLPGIHNHSLSLKLRHCLQLTIE